jgi:hypothetical protein
MSRRRSRHGAEQRRRFFILLAKLLGVAGVLGVTAYYAYEVGFRVAEGETTSLSEGLQKAEERIMAEQASAEADRLALSEANKKFAALNAAYEQIRPSDEVRDLDALVRKKLADGMTARRLALVIKSAETPHDCQSVAARRLQVRSLHSKGNGGAAQLRFDEKLTLSAEDVAGNDAHQQWFDPASPLHVRFSVEGVRDIEAVGTLPIEYAVLVQSNEYHFTLTASSAKGWVEVVTEKCSFR